VFTRRPYSLNCHGSTMLVSHMLHGTAQSSKAHRTESVSVMGHELTMGVSSTGSDQKQRNIFGRNSLFWSVALRGHHVQRNGGYHDWLIQTPVSTVQWGMLVRLNADTCTPGHTLCIHFSAERAANVVDLKRQWWCGQTLWYGMIRGDSRLINIWHG